MKASRDEIIRLLQLQGDPMKALFARSEQVKAQQVGRTTYLRGLIELSNVCRKDCLYCGIRRSNTKVDRYSLPVPEVVQAARFAYDNGYGSVVLQAGERQSEAFTAQIEDILSQIRHFSAGNLAVTLSLGEQSSETLLRWKKAGADRYLLRIEESNPQLYALLHPADRRHSYSERLSTLGLLRRLDYQVGTGVMIGLPFQTVEHLADDLLFMLKADIDMCGMGPYLEHPDTPLYVHKGDLWPVQERFEMTLKMIAVLRLLMPDINIAATTALQAIDPVGREKALKIGANVMMPNITPSAVRASYRLYDNKPCTDDAPDECNDCALVRIQLSGDAVGYGKPGNSLRYGKRRR